MINIVLVEPEIPQNTGNIARTCAATGSALHLVRPLGFEITDKHLKRAGLDYWQFLDLTYHDSLEAFMDKHGGDKLFFASTKSAKNYSDVSYPDGCYILFGKETKGLPEKLLKDNYGDCIRIPMKDDIRSLNLSNSVAVILYEALRQHSFFDLNAVGKINL